MSTRPALRRQFGGTLIGLIAGLVIGLAIALGVALYITKAPLPFMNRFQERPSSAASGAANWNPNQGLSGATAAPPAGSGSMPVTVASRPLSAQALAKLGQPGPGASQSAAAAAPNAQPAIAAPAATPAAPTEVSYVLQVGAYSTQDDAERQRAKVALTGQEAHVDERVVNGRTLYRVRVGPFTSAQQAEKTQKLLSDNGIQTALVRTGK
ncbi:MAG: SPOR domain-containing protein [Thiomonas sp.]|jgi:cell division protein FtsN